MSGWLPAPLRAPSYIDEHLLTTIANGIQNCALFFAPFFQSAAGLRWEHFVSIDRSLTSLVNTTNT